MTQPLKICYNAAQARFADPLPEWLQNNLWLSTKWINKSIDYQNYRNNSFRKYKPKQAEFYCFNKEDNSFPTGLIPRILDSLVAKNIPYQLERSFDLLESTPTALPDWAFEHQREATAVALKYRRGLISSPTGSGKTLMLAFIASQFPTAQTLVITTSIDTFKGVHKVLSDYLNEEVGLVGDSKSRWRRVTVGLINSLALHAEGKYKEQMSNLQILLADEVHHMGNSYGTSISNACINTSYRIGLSGTLQRADGADLLVEGAFGPQILKIPESAMVKLGVTMQPSCYFVIPAQKKLDLVGTDQRYKDVRDEIYKEGIVNNLERNKLAVRLISAFLDSPIRTGSALVLVQLIEHGYALQKLFTAAGYDVPFVHGKSLKQDRTEVIDLLSEKHVPIVIASTIFDEGIDIPSLELVCNVSGGSNQRAIIQRIGRSNRVDRKVAKTRSIYLDFFDQEVQVLKPQALKRMQHISGRYKDAVKILTEQQALDALKNG